MSTSIQVLENRLKRNRMAGDPPDVLIQPFCPQISTLDFHRAKEAIEAGKAAVEKKWMNYYRWCETDNQVVHSQVLLRLILKGATAFYEPLLIDLVRRGKEWRNH